MSPNGDFYSLRSVPQRCKMRAVLRVPSGGICSKQRCAVGLRRPIIRGLTELPEERSNIANQKLGCDASLTSRRCSANLVAGLASGALLLALNLNLWLVGLYGANDLAISVSAWRLGVRRGDDLTMFLRMGSRACWRGHHCRIGHFCIHCVHDRKFALWVRPMIRLYF